MGRSSSVGARMLGTAVVVTTALGTLAASQDLASQPAPRFAPSIGCVQPPSTSLAPANPPGKCAGISVSDPMPTFSAPPGGMAATIATAAGDPGESLVTATLSGGNLAVWSFMTDPNCGLVTGGGSSTCTYGSGSASGLPYPITLICHPPDNQAYAVTVSVTGNDSINGSGDGSSTTLVCSGTGSSTTIDTGNIFYAMPPMALTLMEGVAGSTAVAVASAGGSDHFVSIAITDDGTGTGTVFSLQDPLGCTASGSNACTFSSPPPLGSASFTVQCTTNDLVDHTANLVVTGDDGSGDSATAPLECSASAPTQGPNAKLGGDIVIVTQVNVPATGTTTINDLGGSGSMPLTYTTSITAGGALFTAENCTGGCSLMGGAGSDLDVLYSPVHWSNADVGQLTVATNGSNGTSVVSITGSASGAELHMTTPAELSISVPLNQLGSAEVDLHDDGNIALTTTVTNVTAPFGTDATAISLGSGADGSFHVTCGSSAPTTGSAEDTITLQTPGAYLGSSMPIQVSCTIANTNIHIDPTMFDFGEVRVGDPVPPQTLTISNPTSQSVAISSVGLLRGGDDGVSLTPDLHATLTTLGPGSAMTVSVALSSAAQTDLDTPPEAVTIAVTDNGVSSNLSLPVRGKVVLASSTLSPSELDLGTACVGHPASAIAILSNTGTATLHVSAPTVDQGFTVGYTDPAAYPTGGAAIEPGDTARATLTPTSTAAGTYTGTLTWMDDVPSAYSVPISLTYLGTGTAVSPLDLAFGTVAIGIESQQPDTITLENCGDTATTIDVGKINPVNGTASAWHVSPSGTGLPIAPHGKISLAVTFAPLYPDHYNASLQLVLDGNPTAVQLSGDGTGSTLERTFYGCGCEGGGSPERNVPLAGAVLALIFRRRRGSSSAR